MTKLKKGDIVVEDKEVVFWKDVKGQATDKIEVHENEVKILKEMQKLLIEKSKN